MEACECWRDERKDRYHILLQLAEQALTCHIRSVHVAFNEARANNQAVGLNGFFSICALFGNGHNLSIGNSDVANFIKVGLGVHHSAPENHEIVRNKGHLGGVIVMLRLFAVARAVLVVLRVVVREQWISYP